MGKVLITGGSGFIGSHVTEKFLENGCEVVILDNLSTGNEANIKHLNIKLYKSDMRDKKAVEEIFEKEDISHIIHMAAQVSVSHSVEDIRFDMEENIAGLINILEAAAKYKVKKVVFSSTAAVYGVPENVPSVETDNTKPLSPYGLSKLTGEEYLKMYSLFKNLDYVVLRYSNVYGPRQSAHGEAGVVSIFNDKMIAENDVYIDGDGCQTRDFVYVKDVAAANYSCALSDIKNETFNVSTNTKISINDLFLQMKKYSGYSKDAAYRAEREGDIRDSRLDNSKLRKLTGWEPKYSLESGLKEYFEK